MYFIAILIKESLTLNINLIYENYDILNFDSPIKYNKSP